MAAARKDAAVRQGNLAAPEDWQTGGYPAAEPQGHLPRPRPIHSRPRRSPFDAPTATVGATLSLSGYQRFVIAFRLLALAAMLAGVIAGIWWMNTGSYWQVRAVSVAGTSDPRAIAAIRALPLTGGNILRTDVALDARRVTSVPVVASASVRRRYPATLIVQVQLRVPALLWHTAHGDFVVASDGTVLGPTTDVSIAVPGKLPIVSDAQLLAFGGHAPAAGTRLPAATVTMGVQVARQLPGSALDGASVRYAGPRGYIATTSSGLEVYLGDARAAVSALPKACAATSAACVAAGVTRQLGEVRAVLTVCSQQSQTPTLIDLRWGTHPYYQMA